MANKTADIERKLRSLGLSRDVVRAAWPKWWSTEAEFSPSALNDLKFSLSRKLGISPSSLFDEGNATFVWKGTAKFKGLATHTEGEKQILISFGRAISAPLLKCTDVSSRVDLTNISPEVLRLGLLEAGAPAVGLRWLIHLLEMLGIPVVYLRITPLEAKRMAAMAVRIGDRYAILLTRDSSQYAPVLFNIAHELGHIARLHMAEDSALIDSDIEDSSDLDEEEQEANEYAMRLLTGRSSPVFDISRPPSNAAELASAIRVAAKEEHIDPGMLAMSYGYYTKQWKIAHAALKVMYGDAAPVWKDINQYALSKLRLDQLTDDGREFLLSVMGS